MATAHVLQTTHLIGRHNMHETAIKVVEKLHD